MRLFLPLLTMAVGLMLVPFSSSSAIPAAGYTRIYAAGILSLEVPSHWQVVDELTLRNASLAASSLSKSSNPSADILAIRAMPEPPGSTIRVSTAMSSFSVDGVRNLSQGDIAGMKKLARNEISSISSIGILGEIDVSGETLGGLNAVKFVYRRNGYSGTVLETQYHIPVRGGKVIFAYSERENDRQIWRPILEHVVRSVVFEPGIHVEPPSSGE